jgi:hypothetical protein
VLRYIRKLGSNGAVINGRSRKIRDGTFLQEVTEITTHFNFLVYNNSNVQT